MSRIAYWFPNRASTNDTKLDEFLVGANGKFLKDWTWDVYTSYGETSLITDMDNFVWLDHYNALVKQPNFGRGGSITQVAANSAGNSVTYTCTSGIPVFEPWILGPHGEPIFANNFQLTKDCVDAITANMSQKNIVEQRITEADFQGKLATLKAGELRGAFGVSTRKNSSAFEPDELFLATVPAAGETQVDEFYGEVLLPIVKNFDLEIGGRASDFKTGDFQLDAKSYKFLFNWTAGENWRVRGGWQRANRTPNVAELYSGPTTQVYTWSQGDACRADTTEIWGNVPGNPNRAAVQNLCAQLIYRSGGVPGANLFDAGRDNFPNDGSVSANVYRQENVGNPLLRPEVADTYTAGMVWSPRERELSLSVDFYQIELKDVIDVLGFRQAYLQCFNASGTSNPSYSVDNPYCQAIFRDPDSGAATYVQGGNFNFSQRFTSGVDISLNWHKQMAGGTFGINSSINDLITWKQPASSDPDAPLLEYSGYEGTNQGYFKYRLFTQFTYDRGKLGVGLNWRYLPEQKDLSLVQTPTFTALPTKAYNVFNANASWRLNDKIRIRGGIDNVLNTDPRVVGANPNAVNNPTANLGVTNAGDYDVLGRRAYVGVNLSF
jgi:outer membrane receptor protein involved in Fe transport